MEQMDLLSGEIHNIFDEYKAKQQKEMLNKLKEVKCCDCGHKSRIREVRKHMIWCRRLTRFHRIGLCLVTLVAVLITYLFGLARVHNEINSFGGRQCANSFFWPSNECPVAF